MARPFKPTIVKELSGTARKDRLNPDEPKYDPVLPEPPDFLDEEAQKHWKEKGKEFFDKGLLTTVNTGVFAMVCWHWSMWKDAAKQLKELEFTEVTTKGNTVQNILLSIATRHSEAYVKKLVEFGGTPASSMKVKAKKPKKKNPFDKFGGTK